MNINTNRRTTDYAEYFEIRFTYKGYTFVIEGDEYGWIKDPSSTDNCNAFGQAIAGVPAEYRSSVRLTNPAKAFGESMVSSIKGSCNNEDVGFNSNDGITDNMAFWQSYSVKAGEPVVVNESEIPALYEELKEEAIQDYIKYNNLPLDENGNVVILGDDFKEYTRNILQDAIDSLMKSYNQAKANKERGVYYWENVPWPSFSNTILLVLGFDEPQIGYDVALQSCAKLQAYLDDDTKLDSILKKLCNSLGSTDGKTVTVENYYFNMAANGINSYALDTKHELEVKAKLMLYVEDLQQKYPDIAAEYGEYIISLYKRGPLAGTYPGYVDYWAVRDTYDGGDSMFIKLLKMAAGITSTDSYTERGNKIQSFLRQWCTNPGNGYNGKDGLNTDVISLFNYLLGENPKHINFVATQKAAFENSLENPVYKVGTAKELQNVMLTNPFANIELTADIDLAEVNWKTIPMFFGTIDGYVLNESNQAIGYHIKNINKTNGFIAFADGVNFGSIVLEDVLSADGKDMIVQETYGNIIGGNIAPDMVRASDGAVYHSDAIMKLIKPGGYYNPQNVVEISSDNAIEIGAKTPKQSKTPPTGGAGYEVQCNMIAPSSDAGSSTTLYGIEAEIAQYINSKLDPIYQNYYAMYPYGPTDVRLYNFDKDGRLYDKYNWNADAPDYRKFRLEWNDDSVKEACFQEIHAAIQEILEKYSEDLDTIIYDGQTVQFKTKYSDDTYCPTTRIYPVYPGDGQKVQYPEWMPMLYCKPTIDKPIIYTPLTVYETNIPDGTPYDGQNSYIQTAFKGVYITSHIASNGTSSYIVSLWDQSENKYIQIDYLKPESAAALWAGNYDALPFGEDNDFDLLMLSLIFDYNITSNDQIYEKDGKFYILDGQLRYSHGGLQGLREILVESEMNDQSMVVYHDGSNGSTASTPAAPTTPADDVTGSGSANAPAATAPPAADNDYGMDLDEDDGDNDVIDGKLTETDYDTSANDYWEDVLKELEDDEDDDTVDDTVDETVEEEVQPEQTSYAPKADAFRPPVLYTAETLTKTMRRAARNNGMRATGTKGVYRLGSKRYIWDPQSGCFRRYNKSTGTQFIRAITLAYENGFNVTEDYPWTCELNGVYYTFDQIQGIYVPSVN